MDLFAEFTALPVASSITDFSAIKLEDRILDCLAKANDGSPIFLIRDVSPGGYLPVIELRNVSVRFHCNCRVTVSNCTVEDQFAIIACDSNVPDLYEVFVRCVAAALRQLPHKANTSDLQRWVKALLDLFQALGRPSSKALTGLWAELFLIARSGKVAQALESWRTDQFERFDFSCTSGNLEVKATVNEQRHHEFSLEQIQTPVDSVGYVASVLLQPLNGGVGVIDLARDIERVVVDCPELRQKLWRNIIVALGGDFSERLDRRFDLSYAERSLSLYAMSDIPAPKLPNDPRILAVRFRVDLSMVKSVPTNKLRSIWNILFKQ